MYQIIKDGALLNTADELVLLKRQTNGVYVPCEWSEADGVLIGPDNVEPIEGVEVKYLDGAEQMADMEAALALLGYPDSLNTEVINNDI